MRALRLLKTELRGRFDDAKRRSHFELSGKIGDENQILHLRGDEQAVFEMKSIFFDGIADVRALAADQFGRNCDFSVKVNGLLPEKIGFRFQNTLEAFLPRLDSSDQLMGRIGKSTRNILNSAVNLSLELVEGKTLEDLRFFYDKMLVPFAKERHGEKYWLPPFEEFEAVWPENLFLYFVKRDGKRIAGEVFLHNKGLNQLTEWRFGIIEECSADQRLVSACNNWMTLQFYHIAIDMGVDRISLGQVSSRLDDGIFRFKCKWKACFTDVPGNIRYSLKFHSEKSSRILRVVQLVTWKNDKAVALLVLSGLDRIDELLEAVNGAFFDNLQINLYLEKGIDSALVRDRLMKNENRSRFNVLSVEALLAL